MCSSARTVIQWLVWYVTGEKRRDAVEIDQEIVEEFEAFYHKSKFFSAAKFSTISFMFCFAEKVQERVKLGRIRKSGALSVDIVLDSTNWENLSKQELKDYMRLGMMQAVVMAGSRYKLPIEPFEVKLKELQTKLGKIG
jgi:hypothetical protein